MSYLSDREVIEKIQGGLAVLSPRRRLALEALIPLVGLEPDSELYRAAMFPFDPRSQWPALSRLSSCGLTTEIGWRAAGVRDPRLRIPAGVRGATGGALYPVALERVIAIKWGGWCHPDARSQALPLEGDAVIIGSSGPGVWGKGGFAKEHEFTVGVLERSFSPGDAGVVHSIDGGQPGVHCRSRALVWCGPDGGELWAASLDEWGGYAIDPADQRPTKGRRVLGWTDTDALDDALPVRRERLAARPSEE